MFMYFFFIFLGFFVITPAFVVYWIYQIYSERKFYRLLREGKSKEAVEYAFKGKGV